LRSLDLEDGVVLKYLVAWVGEDGGDLTVAVGSHGVVGLHGLDVTDGLTFLHHVTYLDRNFRSVLDQEELTLEWSEYVGTFASGYWGTTQDVSLTGQQANALWGEVVAGIKVLLGGRLSMGWTVRYRRRLMHDDGLPEKTWYVPGYGIQESTRLGYTFNIIIDI
jgi:hypothetical protein